MSYKNVIKRHYEVDLYLMNGIKCTSLLLSDILATANYICDEDDIEKIDIQQERYVVLHTKIGRIYNLDIEDLFVASMLCDSVKEIKEYRIYKVSSVISIDLGNTVKINTSRFNREDE